MAEAPLFLSQEKSCLLRCRRCELHFRWPSASTAELSSVYRALPAGRWNYQTESIHSWEIARAEIEELAREGSVESKPRILDIGAFDGAFLATLPEGWCRSAIEPGEAARGRLEEQGITVVADLLREPSAENRGIYDVATMLDVFEHVPEPDAALRHALAYLRPGGQLLVSTGNAAHWSWRLLEGDHWYLNTPQHIVFGTPGYFRGAADRLGCRLVRVTRHAHRRVGTAERGRQVAETLHYGLRRQSRLTCKIAGFIQRVPGLIYLTHRTHGPYAPGLRDHLFVVLEK
ncbi:class I SAM-dependent methyltransferase [Alienimonas chondri]|nr:class I SAM-dependent methyltransferase [Alienimonas chondri]